MRRKWRGIVAGVIAVMTVAALVLGIMFLLYKQEVEQSRRENVRLWQENAWYREENDRLWEKNNQLWEESNRLPSLSIERGVRFSGLEWAHQIEAKTGQRLEFMVTINSSGVAHNVWVQADLPGLLIYKDALKVDGVAFFGDITKGINIGTLTDCAERVVTFEVQTATASQFPVGTTSLVIPIGVWADCLQKQSGDIIVVVTRTAPAPSGGGSSGPKYDNNKPGGPGPDPKIGNP